MSMLLKESLYFCKSERARIVMLCNGYCLIIVANEEQLQSIPIYSLFSLTGICDTVMILLELMVSDCRVIYHFIHLATAIVSMNMKHLLCLGTFKFIH